MFVIILLFHWFWWVNPYSVDSMWINNRSNFVRFPFQWHSKYVKISHLKHIFFNETILEKRTAFTCFFKKNSARRFSSIEQWMVYKNDMVSVHFSALVMYRILCLWYGIYLFTCCRFHSLILSFVIRFCAYFSWNKNPWQLNTFSRCWFTELPFVGLYIRYCWNENQFFFSDIMLCSVIADQFMLLNLKFI